MSRRVLGRVAAVAVAALLAAGCGDDEKPAESGGDPLTQVRAGAVKTLSTSFHVTMSAPRVEAVGDVDPIGQKLTLDITAQEDGGGAIRQKVRVLGADAYLTLGKTYVRDVDPTKYIQFTAPSTAFASASVLHLAEPYDPSGIKTLAFAFTSARRTGEGHYAGTLDLTKALPATSRGLLPADPDQVRDAGDVVKDIPFEAVVDDNGYLTSTTVRVPTFGTVPAYTTTSTFADFDKKLNVQAPESSEVTEITEELRQILTG